MRFTGDRRGAGVLDETIDRGVAAIAEEIEAAECRRAVLKAAGSRSTPGAYHRGLWQGTSSRAPTTARRAILPASVEFDPTFARAYAGLSFTTFRMYFWVSPQTASTRIEQAFAAAVQSVSADDRDPRAHWRWEGRYGCAARRANRCRAWPQRWTSARNFALGHYNGRLRREPAGRSQAAIYASDLSRRLSPSTAAVRDAGDAWRSRMSAWASCRRPRTGRSRPARPK